MFNRSMAFKHHNNQANHGCQLNEKNNVSAKVKKTTTETIIITIKIIWER